MDEPAVPEGGPGDHESDQEEKEPVFGAKPENRLTAWIAGAAVMLPVAVSWGQVVAPVLIQRAARIVVPPRAGPAASTGAGADEYRGAADPLIDSSTEALLRRVRGHIEAEEWSDVVAIFDEILSSVADPRGRVVEPARRPPADEGPNAAMPEGPVERDPASDGPGPTFSLAEAVVSSDGVLYRPIDAEVRRQLLSLPQEARELYTRTHQAAASRMLERARAEGGSTALATLRQLAVRYPLTEAGRAAWHVLGLRHLDAGRAARAASALEARLELPFGPADPPRAEVLAQAALAHLLSGAERPGRLRLEELESDAAESTILVRGQAVGGHEVRAHPLFERLTAGRSATPESGDGGASWPSARGRFDHCAVRIAEENRPELGSHARWIYPPGFRPPARTGRSSSGSLVPGTAAWGGLVFVRGDASGGNVVALDAGSGKIRWIASPSDLGTEAGTSRVYGQLGDLGLIIQARFPGESATGASSGDDAYVLGIDRASTAHRRSNGSYRFDPNRLVAYGARSGKLIWSVHGASLQRFGVSSLTFIAPPVSCSAAADRMAGATLVATAVSHDSFFLLGLSSAGEPQWCRRLYDYDFSSLRTTTSGHGSGELLAARGDLVLASPGHGVCTAIDSRTGDVLWVSRYRSRIRSQRILPRWVRPAPMITARLAVVTPADSDYMTAFDLDTGAIAWERHFSDEPQIVLGAGESSVYLVSDRLRALNLEDGRDIWEGEPFEESLGRVYGEGFLAADSVALPFTSGAIGVYSTTDGGRTQLIKLQDGRLSGTVYKRLFPVAGTLYGATADAVYAIESQDDSWALMSRERRQDLLKKALLFRAERRFEEALEIYYDLHERYRSRSLRQGVAEKLIATVHEAAQATGDSAFLARVLEREDSILREPSTRRSFELLEARLLLDGDDPEGRKVAVEKFLRLSRLEGVLATSPDDLEVDVATYAADALRDLRLAGEVFESNRPDVFDATPPGQRPGLASLSRLALRANHLESSALALAHLIAATQSDVGAVQALALFDLLLADFPSLATVPTIGARRTALDERARRDSRASPLPALPSVFSDRPLEKRYWVPAQEGFLAESSPRSTPAPAIFAVCGTEVRAYDEHGAIAFKRELRDYPDVSEAKQHLQSQYEEPAAVYFGEGRMVLFTPAGLFGFSYRSSPLATSARENAQAEGRSTAEVKTLRLRWAQPHVHPLLHYTTQSGIGFGGLQLPQAKNFFAEYGLLDADPLVLAPKGELYQVGKDSGKLLWRMTLNATPTSGLEMRGAWTSIRTSGPTGLRRIQLPGSDGRPGRKSFVEGPAKADHQACSALGQLVSVFSGSEFAVLESLTGQILWRKNAYLGRVAFASRDNIWISEPGGRLRARSVRSGRIRKTVRLPGAATVIDIIDDPRSIESGRTDQEARAGGVRRTLIALGGTTSVVSAAAPHGVINKVPTGRDLYVVLLDEAGDKIWESQVHAGGVVYGGAHYHAADGRFILAFNAEGSGDKWYTKLVRVDPRGAGAAGPEESGPEESRPEDREGSRGGVLVEVASIEISGKGTMLPPRLSLLQGAIGLGNTDGFGWLEPGGAAPRGKGTEEGEETKEDGAHPAAGSDDAGRE